MRISTSALFRQAVDSMNQQQISLSRIQEQIATGLRIRTAGDDPAAASRILNLEQSLSDVSNLGDNADLSFQRLGLLDNSLGEINNNLMRVRELIVQANSGTLDSTQLGHINAEVKQRIDAILQISNRQDGEGYYLFTGNDQAAGPPFVQNGSNVTYTGDQGLRQLEIAPGQFVASNIPGSEVFQRIPSGAEVFRVREAAGATGSLQLNSARLADAGLWDGGPYTVTFTDPSNYEVRDASLALVGTGSYSPGDSIDVQGVSMTFGGTPNAGDAMRLDRGINQDVFTTLANISAALQAADDSPGSNTRLANSVYAALEDIDQAFDHINDQRAGVGSRMNSTESALDTHSALNLYYQSNLSKLKDLDYAAASSEMAQQLTALQAAQAAFVRVQGLSLFNFLQ